MRSPGGGGGGKPRKTKKKNTAVGPHAREAQWIPTPGPHLVHAREVGLAGRRWRGRGGGGGGGRVVSFGCLGLSLGLELLARLLVHLNGVTRWSGSKAVGAAAADGAQK